MAARFCGERAAVSAPRAAVPVNAMLRARFLRRYKRFLADVALESGEQITVHCPDPGRMTGLLAPGAAVRCSQSNSRQRRLRHTLEMIRRGRTWVGLHPARANAVARAALAAQMLPALSGYRRIRPEPQVGRSRFDFALQDHAQGAPDALLEVKSVTLADGRRGRFPDAPSQRARRHAEELGAQAAQGRPAALLFVVQRADCDSVEAADDIDPHYGAALRAAAKRGLRLYAIGARVSPRQICAERALPVLL